MKKNGTNENTITESQDLALIRNIFCHRRENFVEYVVNLTHGTLTSGLSSKRIVCKSIKIHYPREHETKNQSWLREISVPIAYCYSLTVLEGKIQKSEENADTERTNLMGWKKLRGNPERNSKEKRLNDFKSGKYPYEPKRAKEDHPFPKEETIWDEVRLQAGSKSIQALCLGTITYVTVNLE